MIEEETNDLPYRIADLELLDDFYSPDSEACHQQHRDEMLCLFRKLYPKLDLQMIFHQALEGEVPLGIVCDVLAYAMGPDPQFSCPFWKNWM